ncbi:MAG: ABC transporter substrate-binding protein, partial [Oscillospiraceae bacterium]
MKKTKIFMALFLALALLCTACAAPVSPTESKKAENTSSAESKGEESKAAEAEPAAAKSGGTIKIGEYILDTQMANKSPFAVGTFAEMLKIIYEPLLIYNEKKGDLEPALAKEFTWNDAKTELTLTVNTGAKWHDGEPFVADDVLYTMQILKDNPEFDRYALWSKIADVKANGDKVVFTTQKALVALPQYLSQILIVPKHIWEKEDAKNFVNEMPVGTGPFKFKEYVTGTSVTLDGNKEYWRGAPKAEN